MKTQKIKAKIFCHLGVSSVNDLKKWMKRHSIHLDLRTRLNWIRLANIIWDAVSCRESAYPIEHVIKATFDTDIKRIPIKVILADYRTGKEIGKVVYG